MAKKIEFCNGKCDICDVEYSIIYNIKGHKYICMPCLEHMYFKFFRNFMPAKYFIALGAMVFVIITMFTIAICR